MHIGTVREYLLKKFFSTFFWNFDLEISRFCHSDTLKNEISWTLTDDKKNFSSRTVPKKIFSDTTSIELSIAPTLKVIRLLEKLRRRFFEKNPPRPGDLK